MKRFRKARILAVVLALSMVVTMLGGCSSGKSDSSGDGTVSFTMDGLPSAEKTEELANYEARQKDFKEKTGCEFERVDFKYDYQTGSAMIEGGNLPTTFTVANTEPQVLISNGWCRDITDLIKETGWDKEWKDDLLDLVSDKDGHIYGIPNSTYALSIVCNKKIFEEAGLVNDDGSIKYPTTWDEVIEDSRIITEKTDAKGFSFTICDNQGGWNFSNVAWNYGADLCTMNDDGSFTANLNSPEVVEAAKVYATLQKEGLLYGDFSVDTRDACYTNVASGLAAMCFGATDSPLALTRDDGIDMPIEDLALIPVPAGPEGDYWLMGGSCQWFSPDATDDQIKAYLEYRKLYDSTPDISDSQRDALEETAKLDTEDYGGVYVSAYMNIYKSGSYYDAVKEVVEKYRNFDWDDYPTFAYTESHPGHAEEEGMCQQMYAFLTSALQQVMVDPDGDIQAVFDKAQQDYQAVLDTAFDVQK